MPAIQKVLIANRGEIAVRIIRGCVEMGVKTVAVYSEADRMAPHVWMADEAYFIGPPHATESYLCIEKLIQVAKDAGCDAVHPGYGFLSEKAEAADAFEKAGLIWIGPPVDAIDKMGDKLTARDTVEASGMPLVPGTAKGEKLSDENLIKAAKGIGFPVLVKAAAGGGGKGMRAVYEEADLAESIRIARREAASAFGDDRVYLEKFITNARHVEIQILGDQHGNVIHLCERDCSIQRRHQKLIEESPSPALDEELRHRMGEAAVNAAKQVGYYSAGTVEFVLDNQTKDFYFLEMNTRLQVEHTVTERVTGVDIVKEMLRIAAGEQLRYRQEDIRIKGHCIECRILAEDAESNFMPSIGRIVGLSQPSGPGVRIDTGIYFGSEITPYYDSMIAKLVVWDENREEAIIRTRRALEEYKITGVATTIPFHIQMMNTAAFQTGEIHTRYLEEDFDLKDLSTPETRLVAAIAATLVAHERTQKAFLLQRTATDGIAWRNYSRHSAFKQRI